MTMGGHRRLKDERGYTLVELLAATAAGLVVCAAALTIVVSSLSFADGDADRVDSDQLGNVAMEKIVQALNSSCVEGYGNSPIVGATGTSAALGSTGAPPSSADTLTFFSSLTDSPVVIPSEVSVSLSPTTGQLVMSTYPWVPTGSTGAYSATPTITANLISNAAPPGSTAATNSTTPVFTYFGYDTSTGTLSDPLLPSPSAGPLGATNASNVAEIGINFQAQPTDGNDSPGDSADLSDSVTLRLTAAANGATGSTGSTTPQPCS
jgi:hypothetical protein